ncbi:FG-GAP-like repeat-containing protein [uncultured Psychroserpens sp.]|uniref:FG-GAP-like repeat-containing protein n=1 Tax=uncultured Psychroserpens sp. TaxID=255436 RepID=UPI002623F105|nr:FG-GAP-like repeat-containing protein [uncultured Psychroserpens sp.]
MKSKLLVLTILACCSLSFGQPANDNFAGAIPITPSVEGTGCASPTFNLPFSTDGTTDSGVQGSCRTSGRDQFFTWTATTNGLFFSSEDPGNPGIVVWSSDGLTEIACTDTFATESINGWTVGDDLVIQIYDFQGTGLADVAFCLEAINYTPPPPMPITFTSQSSGSSGSYRIAVVDMNGDKLDDMVSISQTNVNIREQNAGGGFTTKNITTPSADFLPTWSLAAADYDENGYTDLLYGAGSGVTFMRANSTGTGFTEVSGPQDVFSQRSNFVDINNDGNLDAFVCHDVAPNVYYLNDGSGNLSFNQGGLGDYASGGNYGSIWIDYDNDRDLDMFIAKCGGETARRTNQMHTNDGNENYTENAAAIGLADPMQTWSAAWGDFDSDGDMDVFVGASSGAHKLMRNDGGTFTDISAGSNINTLTSNSTETVTFDFDNDGNLDLVSGNNILFGNGDMTFNVYTNVFPGSGSYGDLNNDGYIDAFNSGNLYINNAESNNNWIKIHTVGTVSNLEGIGARVEVHTPSGIRIRDVKSGDGFRYMNSLNTHIGIGTDATINSVVIYWPSGIIDTVTNPSINTPLEVVEGATLGLENSLTDELIIYPSPAKDVINIESLQLNDSTIYSIFDVTGKRVLNSKLETPTIDVSKLSPGNYILRIVSGTSIKSQKFIKN